MLVGTPHVVEPEGTRDRVDDLRRRDDAPALLETRVVVGGHPGEHGHLFAPQSLDAANPPVIGEAGLLRIARGPSTAEEIREFSIQIGHDHIMRVRCGPCLGLSIPGCAVLGST